MADEKFEWANMDWYKRRPKTEVARTISDYRVVGFEKRDNKTCQIELTFDDGERLMLDARVALNQTYGAMASKKWTVQGLNAEGLSVLLRLVEGEEGK